MSRSGGYKCYNIRCGSCIGKTLCGEPGDGALECDDRMCEKSATDYKSLLSELKNAAEWYALTEPKTAELLKRAAEAIEKEKKEGASVERRKYGQIGEEPSKKEAITNMLSPDCYPFENVDFKIPEDGSILFRVASQLVWYKP